ncbi:hypothetical protein NA57DRAFT_52593 [Rhizodiscina lignyota]|uniref:Uncharacterized protein n=1 Tax=Rhizodiscina lignyota TaxID=1504668 RepID=A0A9P4IK44_9PEZI|nr:hypothetical protein NA57DRAFT_52593 [Rhizodiscina lignyota]
MPSGVQKDIGAVGAHNEQLHHPPYEPQHYLLPPDTVNGYGDQVHYDPPESQPYRPLHISNAQGEQLHTQSPDSQPLPLPLSVNNEPRRGVFRYPDYQGFFQNGHEAYEHMNLRVELDEDPEEAVAISRYKHYAGHYVGELYYAMINTIDVREQTSNAYLNVAKGLIADKDFEAAAWLLLEALIRRHEDGPLQKFEKTLKMAPGDKHLSIDDRFNTMRDCLRIDKLICEDVLKRNKTEAFVHAPLCALKTKKSNKNINEVRSGVIAKGKAAMGLHRQKEPATLSGRSHGHSSTESVVVPTSNLPSSNRPPSNLPPSHTTLHPHPVTTYPTSLGVQSQPQYTPSAHLIGVSGYSNAYVMPRPMSRSVEHGEDPDSGKNGQLQPHGIPSPVSSMHHHSDSLDSILTHSSSLSQRVQPPPMLDLATKKGASRDHEEPSANLLDYNFPSSLPPNSAMAAFTQFTGFQSPQMLNEPQKLPPPTRAVAGAHGLPPLTPLIYTPTTMFGHSLSDVRDEPLSHEGGKRKCDDSPESDDSLFEERHDEEGRGRRPNNKVHRESLDSKRFKMS